MTTHYDIFNGDADGICALLQLRGAQPQDSELITGVKRDISLVANVNAGPGDKLTVLDISFDKNREAVLSALANGASVFYVDHHFPGDIPTHHALHTLIDPQANMTTSALMNSFLNGARAAWAVVGCYGDNMDETAARIAREQAVQGDLNALKELGVLINYNGYGATVDDLHVSPVDLYRRLARFSDPQQVLAEDSTLVEQLREAYNDDMRQAEASPRLFQNDTVTVIELPDAPWARRVSGVYGNALANQAPRCAHAVVTDTPAGYVVSVRAPLANKQGADQVCRQFPTGGGRAAAAGINCLPAAELDTFIDVLSRFYASA